MTNSAIIALHAAHNYQNWGRVACFRYCQRLGVSIGLLTLARQLSAAGKAGF